MPKNDGVLKFINLTSVQNKAGDLVVMNRNGLIAIVDEKGREKEKYSVVYGAKIKFKEGDDVKEGDSLVEWDPYTYAILTEVGGTVQFKDLVDAVTMTEEVDEVTSMSRWVVTQSQDEKRQPQIVIKSSDKHKTVKKYLMPERAHLMVQDGDELNPGDVLAKIPRETTKTKDITGGLPRVVELFEARKPRETCRDHSHRRRRQIRRHRQRDPQDSGDQRKRHGA
jgi:DNA-directed RNA polymerase subunit beta'